MLEVSNSISRLSELDWDFHGDKSDSPFSDLHFHPGRFVPQIPAALVGSLTAPGDRVLDPFCGAGTTLVEVQRLGRSAIGVDLNPVSCLVARAKTFAHGAKEVESHLVGALNRFTEFRMTLLTPSSSSGSISPPSVQLSKWYHAETGAELCRIWAFIQQEDQSPWRELLLFCFSAALMPCCSETRTWGYVCDNVRPLEHRYVDANSVFRDKVAALVESYQRRDMRSTLRPGRPHPPVTVLEGDAAHRLAGIEEDSVDLIVTSPPYFGVVDYIKAQRLTMEWFGMDIEPFRTQEMGARSKRYRRAAFDQYSDDLANVLRQVHRVLKQGRPLAMVIGESTKRASTRDRLMHLLTSTGFESDLVIERRIGPRRRQPASLENELILIATKR